MEVTFNLPAPILEKLRERSVREGRSMDAIVADALGREFDTSATNPPRSEPASDAVHPEILEALGSFVVQPATKRFDPRALEELWAQIGDHGHGLSDDLDWVRQDRVE